MPNTYTAIIKDEGDWWIGWIEEIPGVNAQEKTKSELLASLKTILDEALEFNRQEVEKPLKTTLLKKPSSCEAS
jgi:predicted RNase H-like HicB family nuclease